MFLYFITNLLFCSWPWQNYMKMKWNAKLPNLIDLKLVFKSPQTFSHYWGKHSFKELTTTSFHHHIISLLRFYSSEHGYRALHIIQLSTGKMVNKLKRQGNMGLSCWVKPQELWVMRNLSHLQVDDRDRVIPFVSDLNTSMEKISSQMLDSA